MGSGSILSSTIGEYRLVDFLGAGGMGEVYRAVHAKLGRVVAIKVLTRADQSAGFVERFLNEARIQASLQHQTIATLYDFLDLNGRPCIVMEYVDGQTLAERIRLSGALPLSEAVFIFQAVAEAIHYIHAHGIVHRDIKSNNIKINSAGQIKLLDFGIAKSGATPKLTRTGDVIGTLEYLSPELLKGETADARSDIWALGVLFYEMVTGKAPFEATTIGQLYEKITRAAYVPPAMMNPAVAGEIEAVISRCLKKNPSDRYQSAKQLLQDTMRCAAVVSTPRLSAIDQERPVGREVAIVSAVKENWPILSLAAAGLLIIVASLFIWSDGDRSINQPQVTSHTEASRSSATSAGSGLTSRAGDSGSPSSEVGPPRSILIEVIEGPAEIYRDSQRIGQSPLRLDSRLGEEINLTLKREGFVDQTVQFTVEENKKVYTFLMKRK